MEQRRRRRTGRKFGEHYTTRSYHQALSYAFDRAKERGSELVRWSPNQLRHSCATSLRKKYGLEGSRVALGHLKCETTEIYAERDVNQAIEIAREVG